jgi:uncharacterized protein YdeI (YjbR/CyaY-like superfamily)
MSARAGPLAREVLMRRREFIALVRGTDAILYRIEAVKKPETRARNIADFVAMLERHETVHG